MAVLCHACPLLNSVYFLHLNRLYHIQILLYFKYVQVEVKMKYFYILISYKNYLYIKLNYQFKVEYVFISIPLALAPFCLQILQLYTVKLI